MTCFLLQPSLLGIHGTLGMAGWEVGGWWVSEIAMRWLMDRHFGSMCGVFQGRYKERFKIFNVR